MDNYTLFSYINVKNLFKYFNIRYKNYRTHKLIINKLIINISNKYINNLINYN